MPPLVVPITVNSGLNWGSCVTTSLSAWIIMCEARCRRRARTPSPRLASKRSSETWPAVLHRHSATENRVIRVTQSRASRSESNVSPSPTPSGLTTPAATTATRAGSFFACSLRDWAIVERQNDPRFLIAFLQEAFYKWAETENGSLEVGGLSVEFIQWRFEIR